MQTASAADSRAAAIQPSRANSTQAVSLIANAFTAPSTGNGSSPDISKPTNLEDGNTTTSLAQLDTNTRLAEPKYNISVRTEAMEFHMREYEKLEKERDILEAAAREFEAMDKQSTSILQSLGKLG